MSLRKSKAVNTEDVYLSNNFWYSKSEYSYQGSVFNSAVSCFVFLIAITLSSNFFYQ